MQHDRWDEFLNNSEIAPISQEEILAAAKLTDIREEYHVCTDYFNIKWSTSLDVLLGIRVIETTNVKKVKVQIGGESKTLDEVGDMPVFYFQTFWHSWTLQFDLIDQTQPMKASVVIRFATGDNSIHPLTLLPVSGKLSTGETYVLKDGLVKFSDDCHAPTFAQQVKEYLHSCISPPLRLIYDVQITGPSIDFLKTDFILNQLTVGGVNVYTREQHRYVNLQVETKNVEAVKAHLQGMPLLCFSVEEAYEKSQAQVRQMRQSLEEIVLNRVIA